MIHPCSPSGRCAPVTGAKAGTGQLIAIALAAAGAEVRCTGRRDCVIHRAVLNVNGGWLAR